MTAKRFWLAGLALFILLSLTDFVQTYALVTGSGGVYEANPVADAWLQRHGWGGLAAFKFGAVAVFAGAAALLLVRRPRAGAGVMALGCAALLAVTVYSSRLLADSDRPQQADEGYVEIDLGQANSLLLQPGPPTPVEHTRHRRVPQPPLPHDAE